MSLIPHPVKTPDNSRMSAFKFCDVAYCRFPSTHLTLKHQCGRCNGIGHGRSECSDWTAKNALASLPIKTIPGYLHCTSHICGDRYTHTYESHHCAFCGERHNELICNQQFLHQDQTTQLPPQPPLVLTLPTTPVQPAIQPAIQPAQTPIQPVIIKAKCPVCRMENTLSITKKIFIASDTQSICAICILNPMEILFPQCGHISTCAECTKQLAV